MSNPLPSSLALTTINDGAEIIASDHRNNYSAIQSAVNLLRACLAGGLSGQVLKAADSSDVVWDTAPGAEIGYDQITANVTITGLTDATSTTVIAGSAHTFDGNPVIAEFYTPNVSMPTVNNQAFIVCLFEGATQLARIADVRNQGTAGGLPILARYRFTPAAGSHTYSIKAFVSSTTGTPIVAAGPGGVGTDSPAYLRFTKV